MFGATLVLTHHDSPAIRVAYKNQAVEERYDHVSPMGMIFEFLKIFTKKIKIKFEIWNLKFVFIYFGEK